MSLKYIFIGIGIDNFRIVKNRNSVHYMRLQSFWNYRLLKHSATHQVWCFQQAKVAWNRQRIHITIPAAPSIKFIFNILGKIMSTTKPEIYKTNIIMKTKLCHSYCWFQYYSRAAQKNPIKPLEIDETGKTENHQTKS